jgi:hypothetical protein
MPLLLHVNTTVSALSCLSSSLGWVLHYDVSLPAVGLSCTNRLLPDLWAAGTVMGDLNRRKGVIMDSFNQVG